MGRLKEFIKRVKNHPAVTPVIATILVVTIVLSVSAAVLLWGIPYIERTRATAQQNNVYSQLKLLRETANSLLNSGPGATEENKFSIAEGGLSIKESGTRIVTYYSLDPDHDFYVYDIDDTDSVFNLYMEKGKCTEMKVYWLGTRTAFTNFNPPKSVPPVTDQQNVAGYFSRTQVYNFSNSEAYAFYTRKGNSTPLSYEDPKYVNYTASQIDAISNSSGYNVWFGEYGDSDNPDGYYFNAYYKFKIFNYTVGVSDIQSIRVSWFGHDNLSNGGSFGIYIWNRTKQDWDELGKVTQGEDSDAWHNFSIPSWSQIRNYTLLDANENKYIIIGISGGKNVGLPSVITEGVTGLGTTTATLNGNLTSLGNGSKSCYVWFEYKASGSASWQSTAKQTKTSTGSFSETITGLTPGTKYYFRAVANNSAGTVYGIEKSFTTYKLPSVTTNDATNVGETIATLNGYLNDPGIPASSCQVRFEYGIMSGASITIIGETPWESQSTEGNFSADISGLSEGTTYYFRAVAKNSAGTVYGEWKNFTTDKKPSVTTEDATDIGSTSATLNGYLNDPGIPASSCEVRFEYGTSSGSYSYSTSWQTKTSAGEFQETITDLSEGTTYYYRAVARNDAGTVYGAEKSFTTYKKPSVTTEDATDIGLTSATLNGYLNDPGIPASSCEVRFEYGTSSGSYSYSTSWQTKTSAGEFQETITDLSEGTTYYYRAVARNDAGTVYGAEKSFTTYKKPSVTTEDATDIGSTSATLNGYLNDPGIPASSCEVRFEYGTSSGSYSYSTSWQTKTSAGEFQETITDLSEGTTYYYRAVARNDAGTVYGAEKSFTTYKKPSVTTEDATDIGLTSATLNGYLNDPGIPASSCEVRFEYGTSSGSYSYSTSWQTKTSAGEFQETITDLSEGTTYYYRAVARNDAGTVYGAEKSFTTQTSVCCFPAGTKVLMADLSIKNIEDIKPGEEVLSYDIHSNSYVKAKVLEIIVKEREGVYDINRGLIQPTDDHPLYVRKSDGREGWAAIDPEKSSEVYRISGLMRLEKGDKLFKKGRWIEIRSIEFVPKRMKTYTLDLLGTDTYFANGVLVRNTNCPPPPSCCLKEGTKITMADGSVRNIEDIKPGDRVLSYDTERNLYTVGEVKKIVSPSKRVYEINHGLISLTSDHPIYVMKPDGRKCWAAVDPVLANKVYGYRNVQKLEIGDRMFVQDGRWIEIRSITLGEREVKTYTFGVTSGSHNFFANGILVSNAEEDGSTPCLGCFPAGTKILLADGSVKNIEDIKVGDYLRSLDLKGGSMVTSKVERILMFEGDIYSINGGLIELTESHPLYVMKPTGEKCWASINPSSSKNYGVNIERLEIGDKIYTTKGWIEVKSMERKVKKETVYTIELEGADNFFADGILVKSFVSGHTLYERYIELSVTYKTYDAEPPSTHILNIEDLPTVYYSPDEITISWTGEDDVSDPEDLVYRYRLDPIETEWQPVNGVTSNTSVTYRASDFPDGKFPRGNYTFRVRARDESGKWEVSETGDNTYRFSIIPASDNIPCTVNQGENKTIFLSDNLDNDFVLIELYDDEYDDDRPFGRIWIMDFTVLDYSMSTSSGTYGVAFANGAIIMKYPNGEYIKETPYVTIQDNKVYMHFIQFSTESGFGVYGKGATLSISSRITDSAIREQRDAYKLKMIFAGEGKDAFKEYFDKMYGFSNDRGSLTYTGSSYPISFTMIHTIIECQQKS